MGDFCVPGGQEVDVPPQQAHRKPSIAQYFQYWQFCSSAVGCATGPGVAGVWARAVRSMGSNGSRATPVSTRPSEASRLRREVRCASRRADFSQTTSSTRIATSRVQQQLRGLSELFLIVLQLTAQGIEDQ